MKTSSRWKLRSIGDKILMGLVLASIIGSINVVPARADDDHGRGGRNDNGRYEKKGHEHDRGRHERDRRGYDYRERVYVQPPVIYAPPPPPGIDIFLPRIIIRP